MRRLWLTLLTALALTASGLSSAMAAQACPMQQTVAQAEHDCCPDEDSKQEQPEQQQQQHDMDRCLMGMACRTAPAVAPTFAPIALPKAAILMSAPLMNEPAELSGQLQQLFRPPRTI